MLSHTRGYSLNIDDAQFLGLDVLARRLSWIVRARLLVSRALNHIVATCSCDVMHGVNACALYELCKWLKLMCSCVRLIVSKVGTEDWQQNNVCYMYYCLC